MLDRRGFLLALLAQVIGSRELLASNASRTLREWVRAHEELARRLHQHPERAIEWMRGVEALPIDLDELLRAIDFAKIEREFRFTGDGGTKRVIQAGSVTFGAAIFGLEKGRSITPHGHRNMASAHLLIAGRVHVRNFDRIADEPEHLIIRPTIDDVIDAGAVSTMTTQKNNIHWFTALTDRAFTLDVVTTDLKPGDKSFYIDLVDPRGGSKRGDGTIRAPRIDWNTSVRLYDRP